MNVVQQVDANGGNAANHDECPCRHIFRNYLEEGKSAGTDKSHYQQQPSPGTERLLEAEAHGLPHCLHRHGNTDMYRTDNQRQQHLFVIGGLAYLAHNHEFLQFGGYLQVEEAYTEECSQYGTDDGREYTQRNHQIHHAFHGLGHLLFQDEPECYQHQAVARVSHTEGKEEREERRKYWRRVELCIVGHAVHFCKHFVHACIGVVFQLDGSIVLASGRPYLIISTVFIEKFPHIRLAVFGNPAFHQHYGSFRHLLAVQLDFQQVYFSLKLEVVFLQRTVIRLAEVFQPGMCLHKGFFRTGFLPAQLGEAE